MSDGTDWYQLLSEGWDLMSDEGGMSAVLLFSSLSNKFLISAGLVMSDGYGWVEMMGYRLAIDY